MPPMKPSGWPLPHPWPAGQTHAAAQSIQRFPASAPALLGGPLRLEQAQGHCRLSTARPPTYLATSLTLETLGERAFPHPCAPCSSPSGSGLWVGWAEAAKGSAMLTGSTARRSLLWARAALGHRVELPSPGRGQLGPQPPEFSLGGPPWGQGGQQPGRVPEPSSSAPPALHCPPWHRGPRCITWSYLLTPTAQPGQFSVDNSREPGALAEELQVHDTDYTTFALMVSKRQSGGQRILRVYLLCRMWAIEVKELDRFVCLLGAQGLSEDNIVFPDPAGDACPVRGAGGTCLRAGAPWVCMAYSWGTCGRGLGATEGSA
ncbi:epididymal-specific lipocalin-12 isoform X2 [Artibeus jamaicensis]|uniref:epididymal-specific lipocalin-12 isoform X2 n=1 Tax=Artibeus jamaicensis TaxID=9417 RepID=UPI00235A6FFC|nr:epididymal-specific lipocalin-12 isoform X2 [Artibeus jamaicensis]